MSTLKFIYFGFVTPFFITFSSVFMLLPYKFLQFEFVLLLSNV